MHKKPLSPVYLFHGEEEFLKEEALKRLEGILSRERGGEGKDVFEEDVSPSVLNESLKSMSILGGTRLVVIKKTKKLDKECRKILFQYIKNPLSQNFLVVFLDKEEDRRKWDVSSPGTKLIEFKKLYEADILSWLTSRARDNKKAISMDAAKVFLERLGPDLALLSQGLERVIDYIGAKTVVEVKDIEEILNDEKKDAVFDLTDALASQDLPACLNILNKLFLTLTSPQQIIALLSWQVRRLYTLKMGGAVKMPLFFLKRLRAQAQKFSREKLEECLYGLKKADSEIKEGLKNPKLSLELFFFSFFFQLSETKT